MLPRQRSQPLKVLHKVLLPLLLNQVEMLLLWPKQPPRAR